MKFGGKCKFSLPLLCKTRNCIKKISRNCVLQHQIAVASNLKGKGGAAVLSLFDDAVQHLLPVHKQSEISAFIIVANQIAVQAHGRTAG